MNKKVILALALTFGVMILLLTGCGGRRGIEGIWEHIGDYSVMTLELSNGEWVLTYIIRDPQSWMTGVVSEGTYVIIDNFIHYTIDVAKIYYADGTYNIVVRPGEGALNFAIDGDNMAIKPPGGRVIASPLIGVWTRQ